MTIWPVASLVHLPVLVAGSTTGWPSSSKRIGSVGSRWVVPSAVCWYDVQIGLP